MTTSDIATSLFDGWQPAQTATLIAALIAVMGVAATLLVTSSRARRDHRANLYAQALAGVSDYMEGPYRIRHKDGSTDQRLAVQSKLSDVKSAIDHSTALLQMHAPHAITEAYRDYVRAAQLEAGKQMSDAWLLPPINNDEGANIGQAYSRSYAERYRSQVLTLMQAEIRRRPWQPWRYPAFWLMGRRRLPPPGSSVGPLSLRGPNGSEGDAPTSNEDVSPTTGN